MYSFKYNKRMAEYRKCTIIKFYIYLSYKQPRHCNYYESYKTASRVMTFVTC